MKLLCYGASVTAQKFDSGYFQHLCESSLSSIFNEIEKVTFGASQYEYAGYAFMKDVLERKPDVCVIDWLTPSMKGFNQYKIDLLNKSLIANNCLPIWVFFPRTNNFDSLPEAFHQVKTSAQNFNIPFINLLDFISDFSDSSSKYLRDAVHTTKDGAKIYSDVIENSLINLNLFESIKAAKKSKGYLSDSLKSHEVPTIFSVEKVINNDENIAIDFKWQGGFLEIFFDTIVGPHVPLLKFEVIRDGNNDIVEIINPADPWCFYERAMVVETLRCRLQPGNYEIKISKLAGNPFINKNTKKPIEKIYLDSDRFLDIKRIAINAEARLK